MQMSTILLIKNQSSDEFDIVLISYIDKLYANAAYPISYFLPMC